MSNKRSDITPGEIKLKAANNNNNRFKTNQHKRKSNKAILSTKLAIIY